MRRASRATYPQGSGTQHGPAGSGRTHRCGQPRAHELPPGISPRGGLACCSQFSGHCGARSVSWRRATWLPGSLGTAQRESNDRPAATSGGKPASRLQRPEIERLVADARRGGSGRPFLAAALYGDDS